MDENVIADSTVVTVSYMYTDSVSVHVNELNLLYRQPKKQG